MRIQISPGGMGKMTSLSLPSALSPPYSGIVFTTNESRKFLPRSHGEKFSTRDFQDIKSKNLQDLLLIAVPPCAPA